MGNCFSYIAGGSGALDMENQREAEREAEREAQRDALELEEQEELDRQLLDNGPTVPLPNTVEWREWRWS